MAKVISAYDVETAAAAGQQVLDLPAGAVVTPAARDRARELGIGLGGSPAGYPNGHAGRTNGYARPVGNAPAALGAAGARPPAPIAPPSVPPGGRAVHEIDIKPNYFESPVIDNLMTISLELGAAIWVVKDRLRVIEELLAQTGIITSQMIEQYQPAPDKRQEIIAARDAFIDKIYGILRDNPG